MFSLCSRKKRRKRLARARGELESLFSQGSAPGGPLDHDRGNGSGAGLDRLLDRYASLSADQREIVDRIIEMLEHHIKMEWTKPCS